LENFWKQRLDESSWQKAIGLLEAATTQEALKASTLLENFSARFPNVKPTQKDDNN
jgi:hypothetical protein